MDPVARTEPRSLLHGLPPAAANGAPGPPPSGGRRAPVLLAVLAALLGAGAVVGGLFAAGAIHTAGGVTTTIVERQQAPGAAAEAGALPPATVYARIAPGVVDITARVPTEVQTPFGVETETAVQTGTGSVLDAKGHILTAQHVVSGASSVKVKFQDGVSRTAKIAGEDSATDLAVLTVDPTGLTLHPIALGSSAALRVGDPIYAIGDPFGYTRSLSTGVVSGLDRTIEAPNGFMVAHAIQTDAAMNPGNSGGPLLDGQGRLVGVVDQLATGGSGATTYTGVGFAVPSDVVRSVLADLEQGKTPQHAYLGVAASDAPSAGALIETVQANGPAAKAGLKKGDVILSLGGTKIAGSGDLVAAIAAHSPGDKVTLKVRRGARQLSLVVTLAKQPAQPVS